MSLFDNNSAGKMMRAQQQRRNNDKGNNRKQSNQQQQQRQRKRTQFTNNATEIVRRFDSAAQQPAQEVDTTSDTQVEAVVNVLAEFTSAFTKNLDKPSECRDLIEEYLADISAAMKYYYDPRFEAALPEMNKLLDLMSTNHYASTLLGVLRQNPFENWGEMFKDVALSISILLDTSANKMKDGTVQIYVTDILSSSGMWRTEINQLHEDIGITEDLATDLMIGLPVRPEDMTDLMMRSTYKSFLWDILDHAEENIEILDRGTQKKLFDFFFEDNRGGKLASKVIGRFLSDPEVEKIRNLEGAAALVYGEFKAMLFEKLETYDVRNIAFVLKFIVEQKKRNNNQSTLFTAEDAAKYDTIRKAIMQVVAKDDSAKAFLV